MLCSECFTALNVLDNKTAVCPECDKSFELKVNSNLFKVRLAGGYIKNAMSYDEVAKNVAMGKILPDEYIAAQDGPWITIYESPFLNYLPKGRDSGFKKTRVSAMLYQEKKLSKMTIWMLSGLFWLSFFVNILLLFIIYSQKVHIESLVQQVIGG